MDRRFVGIGVVVAALIAAAILPGIVGKSVIGAAVVDPAVPLVGGCVLARSGVTPGFSDGTNTGNTIRVPRAAAGDCSDPDAARVLAVALNAAVPGSQQVADYDAAWSRLCSTSAAAVGRHVGSPYEWKGDSSRIDFEADLQLQVALVAAQLGDADGPWLACIAQWNNNPIAADLSQPASWNQLASCLDAAGVADYRNAASDEVVRSPGSCARPHLAQILGRSTDSAGEPAIDDFRTGCRDFAVQVTGMADPTAGGRLEVEWVPAESACLLVVVDASRTLTASLYGIGDAPLPWGN
ncbi:MAG: hypothetical protein ACR2P2_11035 [Nakamurella sp.]